MNSQLRYVTVIATLFLLLSSAACGGKVATTPSASTQTAGNAVPTQVPTAASTAQYNAQETIVEAMDISDAVTLDPQVAFEFSSVGAANLLYQRLVKFPLGDLSHVIGDVATDWEVSNDGQHWTFHLRKGLKFASGNELTANDVVYTFKRAVNIPKDPASWLITQTGISADNVDHVVTAPDPYTVKSDLPKPFSPGAFLAVLANPVAGIVDSKTVQAHVQNGDYGTNWLFDHSAGSGPYVLVNWTKDVRMEFAANPNAASQPTIKRIIWLNVPEAATRLDMLNRGEADIAEGLSSTQIESVQNNPAFQIYKAPDESMVYLGMDVQNVPCFQKAECRNAVKWAIDYDGIVSQLLHGFAQPLQGIIPRGIFGYTDKPYFRQDLAKAKQLLAQAGYPNGFRVEMLVPNGTLPGGIPASTLTNVIEDNLAKTGINVAIPHLESAQMHPQYREHKAQLILAQWSMDYPDPQDFAGPFADYTQRSLIWRLQDNDQQLAQLAQQAASLQNTPQLQQLYDQINDLEATQGPFAILY